MSVFDKRDGVTLIHGDATKLSEYIEPESVDLIVTSPPYFALRSYRDGGEHFDGQLGSEPTPQAFLEALWAVTAECWKVLRPSGSLFVDLGDKRAGSGGGNQNGLKQYRGGGLNGFDGPTKYNQAAFGRPKSKMLLPHRYAIGCEDGLADPDGRGWVMRSDLVWCLSGGARVYARINGQARPLMIRDLVRAYQPADVQLWNGHHWTQVLGWNQSVDTDGALELELRSGERIGCTPGHQWPTNRGLLRADELKVGDVLDLVRLPAGNREPEALNDGDIGWLVGLYIAEGSRSETTVQFAGHINETARHAHLARIADAYDAPCHVYQTSENGATCNISGPIIAGIIDRYVSAGTAHTKRLTVHAWQRSTTFLAAVAAGYLAGDGHYDAKNDRWRLGFTANDEWAADLRTLSAVLGASISLRRGTSSAFGKVWPGWRGEWRWTRPIGSSPRSAIVAVRRSRARQFWDIGVADEPHLYALASGVLTHNSKPNGLPESVTDRCRDSHEYIFHLTKSERYYSAIDEVREEQTTAHIQQQLSSQRDMDRKTLGKQGLHDYVNPLGKLPGSVWTIPSEPLKVPAGLGIDHFACVDAETEILTKRGWLRHDQVKIGDQVGGYLLDTGVSRWTTVRAVNRYDYDGDLVAVDKRDLSMRLTPNHRCVVESKAGHETVVRADKLAPRHYIPRAAAHWAGGPGIADRGRPWCAILGWVAAEGWYQGRIVRISQSFTANPQHCATLSELLGPPGNVRDRERNGRTWSEAEWRLDDELSARVQEAMPDKLLPWDVLEWSADDQAALFHAFVDGDGHRRPDGRVAVFQKHRHNLDVLAAVAVRLGYRVRVSEGAGRFILYANQGDRALTLRGTNGRNRPIPREHYKGVVWCPTTDTGTFYARRNGTVFITGNSFPTELPRRCILGWSPPGYCVECGEARRPVVEKQPTNIREQDDGRKTAEALASERGARPLLGARNGVRFEYERSILGYSCACPTPDAPTRPAVVLDPFGGTGTTAMVARALGRHAIHVDLSLDYLRLARWRIWESDGAAKVYKRTTGGTMPDPNQPSLFGEGT